MPFKEKQLLIDKRDIRIEEMEISQAEFAARLGTTGKTLSKLLNGKANITSDLAKKLSVMMGTSANLWLNLQNTYDQKLIEIQKEKDFKEQKTEGLCYCERFMKVEV